ncbi:putative ribonuclease H-like domain-containing protein [Medicago truncatula]|uniref:Putative ribonuclease H-like domain-containing protein n=1 Tax=Medicago truncatula TaxID=3880 RepID=A0A396IPH5_MEDTR|nr:putative ribonuclease H-like domain-containing protein [Medicago truncatula]
MVMWSYHTTPHSSTQETPFRMVYGSDAMIPIEVMEPNARVLFAQEEVNNSNLLNNLDFQEEV